jgi:hypothetical protein
MSPLPNKTLRAVQENNTDKPVILKGRSIAQQKAIAPPNQESIELYWSVGKYISDHPVQNHI